MSLIVTQQYVEVLGPGNGTIHVTQQYVEVLGYATVQELAISTQILIGQTLEFSVPGRKYLTSILTVGQTVSAYDSSKHVSLNNGLVISHIVAVQYRPGTPSPATSSIILGQTAVGYNLTKHKTATTPLSVSQQIYGFDATKKKSLTQPLTINQAIIYVGPQFASVVSLVTLNQIIYAGVPYSLSGTNPLTVGQAINYVGPHNITVSNAIAITQYADTRIKTRSTSSDINSLGQIVTAIDTLHVVNSIILTQAADHGVYKEACTTQVSLGQIARGNLSYLTASNQITLDNGVLRSNIQHWSVQTNTNLGQGISVIKPIHVTVISALIDTVLVFDRNLGRYVPVAQGIDQKVIGNFSTTYHLNQYLQTNHFVTVSHVRFDAISANVSSALTVDNYTNLGPFAELNNFISLGQTVNGFVSQNPIQQLILEQTVVGNVSKALQTLSKIALDSGLGYVTNHDVRCLYHPFIGNTIPGLPIPPPPGLPPLPGNTGIQFYYPFEDTPVYTWSTKRTPDFGNKDQMMFQRINRMTRGGRLILFADSAWPKDTTMVMTIAALDEDETQAYLQFVQNTLGKEIGFIDWMGRILRGVITNVQDSVTRNGRQDNAININFEVTTRAFPLFISTPLTINQLMDRKEDTFNRNPTTPLELNATTQRRTVWDRSTYSMVNLQHNWQYNASLQQQTVSDLSVDDVTVTNRDGKREMADELLIGQTASYILN